MYIKGLPQSLVHHHRCIVSGDYCALAIIIMESYAGLSVQKGDMVSGIPWSVLQQTRLWRLCYGTQSSRLLRSKGEQFPVWEPGLAADILFARTGDYCLLSTY